MLARPNASLEIYRLISRKTFQADSLSSDFSGGGESIALSSEGTGEEDAAAGKRCCG